ncbi:MFS transporter [Carboxylicivirga sediminis]|uniref:Lysosomal dipeptide transporter MFSD1 n=1 Tax=Carboxylicivirga sediminis TaxID=2006564 RepID=A0A941F747_9BACT|nr:MFS transporter [Carboxylicivirga sediminis]MBR8537714.1 MFS transporter [Carboxylicivirga sediminis]
MNTIKKALNESAAMRWGVLLLVGFVLSVNYYFYDAFSTLKDDMRTVFGFTGTDYGLFASFYSVPNTFLLMAVIGGIILDKIGIRRTGFLFVLFMTIGAFLTAYGASDYFNNGGFGYELMSSFLPRFSPELKVMLLGRFFFGLGAETTIVVVSKILVKWFNGKDLALAFGLKVAFGRLGSFAALRISPFISNEGTNLSSAIWFGAILVSIGLLAFLVYMLFDAKLDRQIQPVNNASTTDSFSIRDIIDLLKNRAYLYIALLCVTFYSAIFPFNHYAPDFISDKFGLSSIESGNLTSFLPMGTLIFTPIFGALIDRKGKSASAMIFGAITLLITHLLFALTYTPPLIPIILLGIAYALVPAAMWPTMVKLVDENKIGTAYGLMYSIQNLGLFVFPLLAGAILDATNPGNPEISDYTATILMFAAVSLLGLIFALLLKFEDKKKGFGVELPLNKK